MGSPWELLALVAGGAMVVAGILDAVLSVMHPTRHGPVSALSSRATWTATKAVARAAGRPGLMGVAAPLAVVTVFAGWVSLLWGGFALIYLPYIDDFSYSTSVDYGDRGLVEALYVSGTAMTTVGFGDVIGPTDALRLVTVAQAAAGFGVITAAITYLLSIYPLVSSVATAARTLVSQADDPERAAMMVSQGGAGYLQAVQQQLIAIDEDTQRFPLLFYFRPRDPATMISTVLRGGIMVCLQARWGVDERAAPFARVHGEELRLRIEEIIAHYATRFLFRDPERDFERALTTDDAQARLDRLVRAADGARDAALDERELQRFAAFVGCCDAFLEDLARQRLLTSRPLLSARAGAGAAESSLVS